ncbi:hypothetical protein SKDZ_13G0860 [Saccharomyces kudriavzevii ZP591]|uniref:YML053C-like protein n=2 Tax=Saccharomyces TaxID=4930 RepID=H0GZ07_SACCK|nr:Yml053cp [Saccharomyces kudriavzevii]EHN00949.1 YML053C-like protein [Saccharomyces cerevisiae x Saccharomyces kudriavzevii VIN7]CAI4047708.1 hypothetical protein SKDZ_13G0860 [Saccharomyces kudriavzevii ZP591]
MLSYYEHNTAFQANNCNSGSNAATTYSSNSSNESIVNKRNNDHFEFDTHAFYQRPKRTKRDSANTRSSSSAGAANSYNGSSASAANNNNIPYQKNIEMSPLQSANMRQSMDNHSLSESEFYSETEEYMIHGYFGRNNHEITGDVTSGSASAIQHQYHFLAPQNTIASHLPSTAITTLTSNNIADDYMDID